MAEAASAQHDAALRKVALVLLAVFWSITKRVLGAAALMLLSARASEYCRARLREPGRPKTCVIVVLGDFGRSPRMQQHALAIADAGLDVVVVAHGGSDPPRRVRENPSIAVLPLRAFVVPGWLPTLVALPFKAASQAASLLFTIGVRAPHADTILLQNPPAIPTLAVATLVCALRGSRLVIDWHNFGYTVLRVSMLARRGQPTSGRLGAGGRLLIGVAEAFERICCRGATAHLCVSEAMARELRDNWRVRATVLYDRPSAAFSPLDLKSRHLVLCRLQRDLLARVHPPLPDELGGCLAACLCRGSSPGAQRMVGRLRRKSLARLLRSHCAQTALPSYSLERAGVRTRITQSC